jgi:hypothetical protein
MARAANEPVQSQQLLLGLAEQLKLPLLQIARRAELGTLNQAVDAAAIQATADSALKLIDSYVLGVRLAESNQTSMALEPVSVASVLYDTAHELSQVAKFYGVRLELSIGGKYEPVTANREGLQSALTSLGMSLIEALPTLDSRQLLLQLGAHKSRYGIVAGLYSDTAALNTESFRKGAQLIGKSRQPLVGVSHSSGAGIFVADAILQAMQLKLQPTRHNRLYGLGAVLKPNNQLQLV